MTDIAPRNRRTGNYWEPIYSTNEISNFTEKDFTDNSLTGFQNATFNSKNDLLNDNKTIIIENKNFAECDFSGEFKAKIVFKKCDFHKCDFGTSQWNKAKFTSCKFAFTSFTQSIFHDCEFRDCGWSNVKFSGNETNIEKTIITNPVDFIESFYYTEETILKKKDINIRSDRAKSEETKLTMSKIILKNLELEGSDDSYYSALKIYNIQSSKARLENLKIELNDKNNIYSLWIFVKIVFSYFDGKIISVSGWMNDWGRSIAKPAFFGWFLILFFAFVYYLIGGRNNFLLSIISSIDITLLVGYTKHASVTTPLYLQGVYVINMVLGLWWYAIFVPTVVNRISRVR